MQRRLLAACGALCAALVVPLPSAEATAADSDCPDYPGLEVNEWTGPSGAGDSGIWNADSNWSRGSYPRSTSIGQVVCIRTAGTVVMPDGAQLAVHVAAVDLGSGVLEVQRTNQLFMDADPEVATSTVASGARLEMQSAVLGGLGRLEVHGKVTLTAAKGSNVLTTRDCARNCDAKLRRGRHGTLSVETDGLLRILQGPVRVTDSYHIVVIGGEARMQGERGQVIADRGTRLALRRDSNEGDPALTLLNNGGWYESMRSSPLSRTRVLIHGGTLAKLDGDGTSSIQGKVSADPGVNARIETGQLAIAGVDPHKVTTVVTNRSSYSTGSCIPDDEPFACLPVASRDDTQIASVRLPGTAEPLQVKIKEKPAPPGSPPLTVAIAFVGKAPPGSRSTASRGTSGTPRGVDADHPIVLELRYDASVVGALTPASDVRVAQKLTYGDDLPDCDLSTGQIPSDSSGCVDRRPGTSRFEGDDLVMVVRTLHFSRYVCH